MEQTLYRRPLPDGCIAFSSPEGRGLFAEALTAGELDGYFPLAEQFHTQAEPAFCGLGSLVVALNALAIDPGRLWKGPWRWFGEEMLDCCVDLAEVRARGLDLDEVACLARCNGAEVVLRRGDRDGLDSWREDLARASRGEVVAIASYDRATLDQTGSGHFSPIGGYHRARDLVLVLDVARFKYPPHWVPAERLFGAMVPIDPVTGRSRGWLVLRARSRGISLGYSVKCDDVGWSGLARVFGELWVKARRATDLGALVRAVRPLAARLEARTPEAPAHRDALAQARGALRALPAWSQVAAVVGEQEADRVTLLLLAAAELLPPELLPQEQRDLLAASLRAGAEQGALAGDVTSLREQLAALWAHARGDAIPAKATRG